MDMVLTVIFEIESSNIMNWNLNSKTFRAEKGVASQMGKAMMVTTMEKKND